MGYSAKAVANYFLSKYSDHGITPLKMQKLVYLAHGWSFAYHEDPLINDELAEAWEHGPVFPSVYHEFKYRGRLPILEPAVDHTFKDGKLVTRTPKIPKSDKDTQSLLDRIWNVYEKYTGGQLSELCHRPGSPWAETKRDIRNAHIDNDKIKKYYRKLAESNTKGA